MSMVTACFYCLRVAKNYCRHNKPTEDILTFHSSITQVYYYINNISNGYSLHARTLKLKQPNGIQPSLI